MITDTVSLDWVFVPAGPFLMGSDRERDRRAWGNEEPQHIICLDAFWISKTTITNSHYLRFVQDTRHRAPEHWKDGAVPDGKDMHPVVFVDWDDAVSFCDWVNGRLPTEAEWEKAARGTAGRVYPWGDERPNRRLCNHNFFFGDTLPVGSHPNGASPYGLLDMAGNVWEWTASKPRPYPYDNEDSSEFAADDEFRVLRGGAFRTVNPPRCAFRDVGTPRTQATNFRGFRVARPA